MDVTIMDSITNVRTLKYAHSSATVAGTPIVVNGHVLIPVNAKDADEDNTYVYWGKVQFAKADSLAIDPGEVCYWDADDEEINKDSPGNTPAGICVEAAAEADETVIVMLLPNIELVDAGEIRLAEAKILVGAATGIAAAKTPSGDVTIDVDGVTAIGAKKVTAAMLADGAGLAALITAGLGASATYAKTTSGAQTLLAANGSGEGARIVLIVVVVTETFAAGDGAATIFDFGETDSVTKFKDDLNSGTAGDIVIYAGSLTEEKALLVTAAAATGTGAGAIAVTVLALPAAA